MILDVEHTSGGRKCHCCETLQELVTERQLVDGEPINLRMSYQTRSPDRIRLCASCTRLFYEDLKRALRR